MDIMNFFSIDCSTDLGSLFVKAKNKTFSKILQSDKSNNDLLMKQILDFFDQNNLNFDEVGQIFVNQGPGNFSGLRGSLAIAKGLSLAKKLNLCGYNTFIWSCAKFYNKKNITVSIIKIRKKYYIQKFDKKLNILIKPKEISEEEILEKYQGEFKVLPKNTCAQFSDKILKLKNLIIVDLNHKDLEFLHLQGLLNKDLIKPLYLS